MKIITIPCAADNYVYLIICEESGAVGVVDPCEAGPVLERLEKEGLELRAILATHHHGDHVEGIGELRERFPAAVVLGHKSDVGRIEGLSDGLETGQRIELGRLEGRALHTPGHTRGGISYLFGDSIFTGDTLFAAGCGRLFEGTPAMMYDSLHRVIGELPESSKVYFGHEYTEANLRFAQWVEPDNPEAMKKLEEVGRLRREGRFTTPTTLGEEWLTNPFMRCDSATIRQKVKEEDPGNDLSPVSVLAMVRTMKDSF